MRFICEIEGSQHLIDAQSFEAAAELAAREHADSCGKTTGTYRVNVAEANGADFPLIAGDDYTVTLGG